MAMSCLNRGLHVYCQKPLTHDIYESRRLAEVAREKGLVTQMGIQIHSHEAYKTAVAMVQQGTIGKVREIHTWSDKKWSDPNPRPEKSDPVPENLDWNQWLGVCAERPFIGEGYYHPGNWRKRLDFGTGTFGDMGCHILDPVFSALKLTAPVSIRSEGSAPNQWNWSQDAIVKFVFPATEFTAGPTVALTWYDGDRKPPVELAKQHAGETPLPGQGSLLIGESGSLIIPHIAMPIVLRDAKVAEVDFPQIPGKNHWHEFIDAAAGTDKTSTYFDYAGPLTEAVLLGGIATRYPKTTLEWDAVNLKFKNLPEANAFVRKDYRAGWEVEGLS
jgi:predicted dehydrogenase